MADVVVFLSMSMTMTYFLAPRIFRMCDARVCRGRLGQSSTRASTDNRKPITSAPADKTLSQRGESATRNKPIRSRTTATIDMSDRCDSLARLTRSGIGARDAFERVFHVGANGAEQNSHQTLEQLLIHIRGMMRNEDFELIRASVMNGNFEPSALEMAARNMRDRVAHSADITVAGAHASLSARVLTHLPLVMLAACAIFSSRFRSLALSPGGGVLLCIGLVVNWIGRRWMRHIISSTTRGEDDSLGFIIDHLCVSLRAGHSLADACARLAVTGPCGNEIAERIALRSPLESALQPLTDYFGMNGRQLADIVTTAQWDGQPVLTTVDRLSAENRSARRREVDRHIRQLPGKLSVPLVLFILPSFMLLSVAPLVLVSVDQLSRALPPNTP